MMKNVAKFLLLAVALGMVACKPAATALKNSNRNKEAGKAIGKGIGLGAKAYGASGEEDQ